MDSMAGDPLETAVASAMARWSSVRPSELLSGKMSFWPWTVTSDPGGRSSSVPAASKRMTYWPVSVNSSRPIPRKLRLIVAMRPGEES